MAVFAVGYALSEILENAWPFFGGIAVAYALMAWALWTTKALFNRHDFHAADALIVALMVYPALAVGLGFLAGSTGVLGETPEGKIPKLRLGLLSGAVLVWAVLGLALGFKAVRFGARAGVLWRVVGAVYVVGWIIFAMGPLVALADLVVQSIKGEGASGFTLYFAFLGMVVGAAVVGIAWICHGAGLLIGAARIRAA